MAGRARVGDAEQDDLRVEREQHPERGAEVERRQGRIDRRDEVRAAADGGEAVAVGGGAAGVGPAAGGLGDRAHLGRVARRVDERALAGRGRCLVLERERGHDQGAPRSEDLEERIDDGLGAALDVAERPKPRVDEGDLAFAQADAMEAIDDVPARDGGRGGRRVAGCSRSRQDLPGGLPADDGRGIDDVPEVALRGGPRRRGPAGRGRAGRREGWSAGRPARERKTSMSRSASAVARVTRSRIANRRTIALPIGPRPRSPPPRASGPAG